MLMWLHCERRGRPRLGLLALGAGYGIAVFTKQQGAFVAMGAFGLAPILWGRSRPWREGLVDAVAVVATALAVFGAAMALDGGGIAALKLGVATAVDYESRGQLIAHLIELARKSPALFAALAGAVCLWPAAFAIERRRRSDDRTVLLTVWALGAATAAVSLLQFSKRGYAHYGLLTLPFALIAIATAASWGWEQIVIFFALRHGAKRSPRAIRRLGLAVVAVVASLLSIEAWALPRASGPPEPLRHELDAHLCAGIQPGQRLLLLPSRDNALHWACGTNARGTRWGYTFNLQERPDEYIEELAKPDLTQVFVFKADREHPYEQEVARRHDWTEFFTALEQQGFHPIAQTDAGTLYRRGPDPALHEETGHGRD
jgi:4-amino-4-deoxy-L-arabinose transferase-like glycosyltransferase